ncbi:uncharacterized protein GGS22DRAFT_196271 [Annulohypoxylon maeteangense]|uniref:uncharacterized protein n=1 Tax=Annulohypoxylon maeteangense TaxID=1927788 RepID=UPI0020089F8D|nr:uncharacterized protein GGS22DRAFT_196271 [Annulohypoxylon maeteangense]KAI0881723.1 hypothetical protein GGS22DRAFT_196271 [Annulohypoxylon maeteangense]
MSKQQMGEETPEPKDPSHQPVKAVPSPRTLADIKDKLEAIKKLKVNALLLRSSDARERFPEFPQLHDLTWLTLHNKIKLAITFAEDFLKKADSTGWLREQASFPGQGNRRKWSREMRYSCEKAITMLEDVTALQSQILAGQHRKPEGEKQLKSPEFPPWAVRPARHQLPDPRTHYHSKTQHLINPYYYVPLKHLTRRGKGAGDTERFRVILRPDVVTLEERKSSREQNDNHPPLLPIKHVPLSKIAKRMPLHKGYQNSAKPLAIFMEEIETSSRDGHPPTRLPDPELAHAVRASHESNDGQTELPSIHEVFSNDEFTKTSFADQIETRKQLSHPQRKRKVDTRVGEDDLRKFQPGLRKSMKTSDFRIAVRHVHNTGELQVCEYFADRSQPYRAQDHWGNFKRKS